MKIYVKYANKNLPKLSIIHKGDWIDLTAAEGCDLSCPTIVNKTIVMPHIFVSLGIAMHLPKGYEAIITPRSSLFKNKGVILTNSIGIIDNSYCGESDIWGANLLCTRIERINEGERILQFRIQLSQKASVFQKLKWLFSSKIKFVEVNKLQCESRGGFGSTRGYK